MPRPYRKQRQNPPAIDMAKVEAAAARLDRSTPPPAPTAPITRIPQDGAIRRYVRHLGDHCSGFHHPNFHH